MTIRRRLIASTVSLLGGLLASSLVTTAAAATPQPTATSSSDYLVATNLRIVGTDSDGFPLLDWDPGPADVDPYQHADWTFSWQPSIGDATLTSAYVRPRPHDTMDDAIGWCIPSGSYQLTLLSWQAPGQWAASNTITVTLPTNPATGE